MKIIKIITIILCITIGMSLYAAGTKLSTVKLDYVGYSGDNGTRFFINIEGTVDGTPPACATSGYRFVGDYSTEHGKMIYSLILAAQLSGKQVYLGGTGYCNIYSNTESISFVRFVY